MHPFPCLSFAFPHQFHLSPFIVWFHRVCDASQCQKEYNHRNMLLTMEVRAGQGHNRLPGNAHTRESTPKWRVSRSDRSVRVASQVWSIWFPSSARQMQRLTPAEPLRVLQRAPAQHLVLLRPPCPLGSFAVVKQQSWVIVEHKRKNAHITAYNLMSLDIFIHPWTRRHIKVINIHHLPEFPHPPPSLFGVRTFNVRSTSTTFLRLHYGILKHRYCVVQQIPRASVLQDVLRVLLE